MSIPTQMSLHGFIATTPQLSFCGNGVARFYARIGVEHRCKEADGSYTKLDPTYHNLVLFHAAAERAYDRFRVGDQFVASGYINEYERERDGEVVMREEFVARRIGHDATRARYDFERQRRTPESPRPDGPRPTESDRTLRAL